MALLTLLGPYNTSFDSNAEGAAGMTKSKGVKRKDPDEPKQCRICGEMKAPEAFYGKGFRLSAYCRSCSKSYQAEFRKLKKPKSAKAIETTKKHEKKRHRSIHMERLAAKKMRINRTIEILNEFHAAGISKRKLERMGIHRSQQNRWLRGLAAPTEASFKMVRELWRVISDHKNGAGAAGKESEE